MIKAPRKRVGGEPEQKESAPVSRCTFSILSITHQKRTFRYKLPRRIIFFEISVYDHPHGFSISRRAKLLRNLRPAPAVKAPAADCHTHLGICDILYLDQCPAVQPVVFIVELFQSFLHGQNVGIGFHPADNDRMLCVRKVFRTAMHCVLRNGFSAGAVFQSGFPGLLCQRAMPTVFVFFEGHFSTSR